MNVMKTMTVSELIKALQKVHSDAIVVTEGYETGYEPIKKVEIINVAENHSTEWWDGKYEKSDKLNALKVVFLNAETKVDKK